MEHKVSNQTNINIIINLKNKDEENRIHNQFEN